MSLASAPADFYAFFIPLYRLYILFLSPHR
ncbi:hypothetical protein CO2235_U1000025 [Cupriavidus oxalaticus]|uniref:Uncharacterized protein n=1 Tax=Cupriavidus oxalaticus TaxID=96344 RepID=A0A375FFU8_9BURK|nr:hypothetical protein CO2235_U1000025 [Cupriavidus oxalaticus]